ncbi:MAG: PQQ-binding-like beta-propeller repeat protein, partial [Caldilinea sp.]
MVHDLDYCRYDDGRTGRTGKIADRQRTFFFADRWRGIAQFHDRCTNPPLKLDCTYFWEKIVSKPFFVNSFPAIIKRLQNSLFVLTVGIALSTLTPVFGQTPPIGQPDSPHNMDVTSQVYLPMIGAAITPTPTLTSTPTPIPTGTSTPRPTGTPVIPPGDRAWPMLAANPERTSWTPEEVRGNLSVEWYLPFEPYIPYKVQPIAANGRIYVSTARGLYSIDAANGNLDWVYGTEMPLGHSPTIATVNGRSVAYVGGYDRKIHAIDAITGEPLPGYTAYIAGAGFETNPLVIGDTIYSGNRDGFFYALDARTGNLKWRYRTDDSIQFSAAYKDGVVYFASNDAHAYALSAT